MKIINKIKILIMIMLSIVVMGNINIYTVFAEEKIASGIYEVSNEVYHDTEIGMSMARSYLKDTMTMKITKNEVLYTIGFTGTDYMENYRVKVNDVEVPVERVDGDGIVTLKVSATSLSDELKACIYVGPMGRDVEFGIIPKLETMSLIESIEEESTEETTENSAIEEIQDNEIMPISENNNTEENSSISKVILFGGVAILVIGIVCTIMLKRKK
ncbi:MULTISPECIES: NEAT domain-containing protein [Clostridia]|uniref:NEAT domain-containing protein n=2 Tax=Clostridia TaxID=186801 RepID=A0A8I0A6X1_9CLOT|nr:MULTISPECIES: NEAT domain-containing protein [Clostridia]MBC5639272.1 NEAT domain-containing protein [Clostridium lentum]MBC5653365.1 NEAT domain-containing protein [Blautia lenta]CDB76056.1 putative iron transporter [Clostridium sp. CAG:265]